MDEDHNSKYSLISEYNRRTITQVEAFEILVKGLGYRVKPRDNIENELAHFKVKNWARLNVSPSQRYRLELARVDLGNLESARKAFQHVATNDGGYQDTFVYMITKARRLLYGDEFHFVNYCVASNVNYAYSFMLGMINECYSYINEAFFIYKTKKDPKKFISSLPKSLLYEPSITNIENILKSKKHI